MAAEPATGGPNRAGRRWLTSRLADRRIQNALLGLLIVALLALPRLTALRGVEMAHQLTHQDGVNHLLNLTLFQHKRTLGDAQLQDPFFGERPTVLVRNNLIGWPPGIYHVASLWVGTFGPYSLWTTQLTNAVFMALLLLGVIGLGLELSGSLRVGLWAAALTAVCPPLVADSWYYSLDFPLTAVTICGLLLLLQTRHFSSLPFTLLFGAWAALGMMIKPSYAVYLLAPALWSTVAGLRLAGSRRPRMVLNLSLGLAVALGLFLLQDSQISERWGMFLGHMQKGPSPVTPDQQILQIFPWTVEGLLLVPKYAAMVFPLPLLLLALPALLFLHLKKTRPRNGALVLVFFWGVGVFVTLFLHRQERYSHPIYPILCLTTAWWVLTVLPRRIRRAAMALTLVAFCGVLWLTATAAPIPWRSLSPYEAHQEPFLGMPTTEELDGLRRNTYHPSLGLREVVAELIRLARAEGTRRPLGVGLRWREGRLDGELFALVANQVIKDRFVSQLLPEAGVRELFPANILLHTPDRDVRADYPGVRVLARRPVRITMHDQQQQLVLTLFRR